MLDWEAAERLSQAYALPKEDVCWAIRATVDCLMADPHRKKGLRYATHVKKAEELLEGWIVYADGYVVDIHDPLDIAKFVRSHMPACVWTVLTVKGEKELRHASKD